ncbi:MAG: S1C family serine protease [Dehalococcoidia bacterium]
MRPSPALRLVGLLAAGSLLFGAACSSDDDNGGSPTTTPGNAATAASQPSGTSSTGNQGGGNSVTKNDIPSIVDEVQPSVVTILVTTNGGEEGQGSGVIWDTSGNIVTNDHVAGDAARLTVVLATGEQVPATFTASDPFTDLAVIKIDHENLTPAEFADELPKVGELAVAIGNPLGFENTVTSGIVSGLHRSVPSGGQTPALVDLIQTDAAISPGNSGGALVNGNGEIMGINVAYIPPAEGAVSIGFGIPAPTVKDTVDQLLKNGSVEHAFLGITPRPLTAAIASQLGLSSDDGVLVFQVAPDAAAANAGVEAGDVIVKFDGKDIASVEDLYAALRNKKPGDRVPMTVLRDNTATNLTITLDARPAGQ